MPAPASQEQQQQQQQVQQRMRGARQREQSTLQGIGATNQATEQQNLRTLNDLSQRLAPNAPVPAPEVGSTGARR